MYLKSLTVDANAFLKIRNLGIYAISALFYLNAAAAEDLALAYNQYRSSTGYQETILVVGNKVLYSKVDSNDYIESSINRDKMTHSFLQFAEPSSESMSLYGKALDDIGVFGWRKKYLIEDGKRASLRCHLGWSLEVSDANRKNKSTGSCAEPGNMARFLRASRLLAFSKPAKKSWPSEQTGDFLLTIDYVHEKKQRIFIIVKGSQLAFARLLPSEKEVWPLEKSGIHYTDLEPSELKAFIQQLIEFGFWKLEYRYMGDEVMETLQNGGSIWDVCQENWRVSLSFRGEYMQSYGFCAEPTDFKKLLRYTESLSKTKSKSGDHSE